MREQAFTDGCSQFIDVLNELMFCLPRTDLADSGKEAAGVDPSSKAVADEDVAGLDVFAGTTLSWSTMLTP